MKTRLDYRDGFLCVVTESIAPGNPSITEWYPVHAAERAEVETLCGRPLTNINLMEGIYVDEEGNVFQLANLGETKPLEVEQLCAGQKSELEALLEASLNGPVPSPPHVDASGQAGEKDGRGIGVKRAHRKRLKVVSARKRRIRRRGYTGEQRNRGRPRS